MPLINCEINQGPTFLNKLLEQFKSGFKRTINRNKYQSRKSIERQNQYLDYLIDSSFQGVNRVFSQTILSSGCRNKKLQCYDWWTKLFWSISKK